MFNVTPEYVAWWSMRQRCNNPKREDYYLYGGRGITVCARWNKFKDFLADMGPKPTRQHSLDRQNNHKGYGPENCRWATPKQQNRNRRNTVWLIHKGVKRPLGEWAELLGTTTGVLRNRIKIYGWSVSRALETPVVYDPGASSRGRGKIISHEGKSMTLAQWAEHLGLAELVIRKRLYRGLSLDRALSPLKFRNGYDTDGEWWRRKA